MIRTSLVGLALAFFAGCNNNGPSADDNVQLEWSNGQTWHLATSYRVANIKGEVKSTGLDGADVNPVDEHWSEEIVWNYQVIENDFVPSADDELYEFASTEAGLKSLTVIRAYIDLTVADVDDGLVQSDPVVYLVFHTDRDRLAGIVQYSNVEGERVAQSWSSHELGKSYNGLSQSMLSAAPTYLAPFGAKFATGERKTEHGKFVNTELTGDGAVDVVFDDEVGGGDVATRYETNKPWPTWTVSENMESRLLSDDDVANMRRTVGNPFGPPPPEDYDFRAALRTSVDIDAATRLDEETMAGGFSAYTPDGYEPWNGYWWPLSDAALVFGYSQSWEDPETFSQLVQDDIEQLKIDMDNLQDELREMDKDSAEYNTKVSEYREKNQQVVSELVEFYDGIRAGLDGGTIVVQGGTISHTVDGWSYDLNGLSPFDKTAVAMYYNLPSDGNNPFYLPAWELLNQYNPGGGSWWGHCNGWAAAAILTDEPTESKMVDINGNNVEFYTGDIKGLLTETHYSTRSQFYGKRYYKEGDDLADLTPAAFTKLVTFYFRDLQVPVVFDTTASEEVWNFPAYGVDLYVNETTDNPGAGLININTATISELEELPGVGPSIALSIVDYREKIGPFQDISEIMEVNGISNGRFGDMQDLITVDVASNERTWAVQANVAFATDGVPATHVDNGSPAPDGFVKTYTYTLTTDDKGVVLSGVWDDINEHPDFAWIPYDNPTYAGNNSSENPFLRTDRLEQLIGDYNRN